MGATGVHAAPHTAPLRSPLRGETTHGELREHFKEKYPTATHDQIAERATGAAEVLAQFDEAAAANLKTSRALLKHGLVGKEWSKTKTSLLLGLAATGVVGTGAVISLMAINAAINSSVQKKMLNNVMSSAVAKAKTNAASA